MVVFAGMEFLFRFFPIFLLIFYLVPKRFREAALLTGSIIFYAFGEIRFVPVLLGATVLNYYLGRARGKGKRRAEEREHKRKRLIITAVIIDAAVLTAFKVAGVWAGGEWFPLGISFYIFKMISWQLELYRGNIAKTPAFVDTAVYFCIFPQLISGPVMRYQEGGFGVPRTVGLKRLGDGFQYCVLGLGMKVLLADRLVILWNDLQMIGFASISPPLAWLGLVAFSLRLYFDFWGYSLMAAGIGMMVGFDFIPNFNHPYAARSISDFYRRWHMTLGRWFRDYVYLPLGGSRAGKGRTVFNLLAVWLLTGLWHGNGINYGIWGLALGLLIVAEKLWLGRIWQKIPLLGHLYVVVMIPLTWLVFAVEDVKQLGVYLGRLFPFLGETGNYINRNDYMDYLQNYGFLLAVGILLCVPAVFGFYERHKKNPAVVAVLVFTFWLSVYYLARQEGNPFMYYQF